MTRRTLLITDDAMLGHDTGPGHPERPARLRQIASALRELDHPGTHWQAPAHAPAESLEAVHDPGYVRHILDLDGRAERLDADTVASPGSVKAALLAAGAAIGAVDALLEDRADSALALVRPPGHHAEPGRAMGFCLFNNIAVAAAHALKTPGIDRVLILDWDVHHGNGTQHIFEHFRDVLFVSLHQHPLWPGTGMAREVGTGEGEGFTINVPLPPGSADADYLCALHALVLPVADRFAPDLVLVSCGFDADARDPLAQMSLSPAAFGAMTHLARSVADRHACGRLALMLEGGYDLDALADGARSVVEALGTPTPEPPPDPGRGSAALDDVRRHLGRYWPL